jgi:hypothetical protein
MIYDVEINSAAHYPAAEVPGLVVLAEQVGFGAFWKGESNSTDPLVMLSAVASRIKASPAGMAASSTGRLSARASTSMSSAKLPPASGSNMKAKFIRPGNVFSFPGSPDIPICRFIWPASGRR